MTVRIALACAVLSVAVALAAGCSIAPGSHASVSVAPPDPQPTLAPPPQDLPPTMQAVYLHVDSHEAGIHVTLEDLP